LVFAQPSEHAEGGKHQKLSNIAVAGLGYSPQALFAAG
jgi:hypothetical protein